MKTALLILGLVVGGACAVLLGGAQHFPVGMVSAEVPQPVQSAGGPEVAGVRFAPAAAVPATAVSQAQAVEAALQVSDAMGPGGKMLPAASVTAQYGAYSNDQYGTRGASGFVPTYQDVPAWIVTFSGLNIPGMNSNPAQSAALDNHEESVVIDGVTGKAIEVYTYQ